MYPLSLSPSLARHWLSFIAQARGRGAGTAQASVHVRAFAELARAFVALRRTHDGQGESDAADAEAELG